MKFQSLVNYIQFSNKIGLDKSRENLILMYLFTCKEVLLIFGRKGIIYNYSQLCIIYIYNFKVIFFFLILLSL